ncbi:Aldehyde oxidase 3 [Carabus blaptoides fortunei]
MGAQASIELQTTKEVKFSVQGELHTINASNDITPETTLNSYLRDYVGLKDTKWMCYEGGCGSCIVAATIPHPVTKRKRTLAVNSFILASADKRQVNPKYQSGGTRIERTLSTGSQEYQTDKKEYPVSEPIHKVDALMQCSGETQYIMDIPVIPNQVYGTFVLSNAEPYTTIVQVDVSEALKMPGVITFVDYKDIPGKNSFTAEILTPHNEPLFTVDKVLYNGQPIGVIVACSLQHAINAADKVKVTYGKSTKKPEYTVQDVLKAKDSSKIENVTIQKAKRRGHNIKHVIKGEFNVGPQYHFHMELHNCLCVPTDDGGYDIFPGTQWIHNVQLAAAAALNMPANKFNVSVKRLGGAYGAKILRANMVSTACVVVSHKLKRPVRVNMTLTQNMKALGKRFPCHAEYEVGVDDKGVIQYMDNTYYSNVGTSGKNEEQTSLMAGYMRSAYNNETWNLNGNLVATDMPGNGFCRGPGACEAIGMIETIMEQISYTVGIEPLKVRQANLVHDQNNMPEFIQEMLNFSDYEKRKKEIDDFNKRNRWMKKGLSFVPMNYHFMLNGPYSVFVAVFAGDGSVGISHGGIESGQGLNTKVIQVCAYMFGIPMDMVCVKPSNELNAPNNHCTGGSLTNEAICYGIIRACKEILKRLEPIKKKMKNPTWNELVLQGFRENIEMCATHVIKFRPHSINPVGTLNSKAVGEPPLCLSISIPLAIRRALADARIDADPKAEKFIEINGATTVEFTLLHTMDDYKKYSL